MSQKYQYWGIMGSYLTLSYQPPLPPPPWKIKCLGITILIFLWMSCQRKESCSILGVFWKQNETEKLIKICSSSRCIIFLCTLSFESTLKLYVNYLNHISFNFPIEVAMKLFSCWIMWWINYFWKSYSCWVNWPTALYIGFSCLVKNVNFHLYISKELSCFRILVLGLSNRGRYKNISDIH